MNVFKQNRSLKIIIVLLVLLNLTALYLLWMGNPARHVDNKDPLNIERENERIKQLLKEELVFDEAQTQKFIRLRHRHLDESKIIQNDIRNFKRQMFDQVLNENESSVISDSLLTLALNRQADLERMTYKYLIDLKELCNPEQLDKLMKLMHRLLPPPGGSPDGPPPPPGGLRPPISD